MNNGLLAIWRIVFFLLFYVITRISLASELETNSEEPEGMEGTGAKVTMPHMDKLAQQGKPTIWDQFIDIDPSLDLLDQLNKPREIQSRANLHKAIQFFEKSLTINLETYGSAHPNIADNYYNLGNAYQDLQQYSKAINYYRQALPIAKGAHQNHLVLTLYNKLGLSTLQNQSPPALALTYFEKAIHFIQARQDAIYESSSNSYTSQVLAGITWYNLGSISLKTGSHEKALPAFEKAKKLLDKQVPSSNPLMQKLAKLIISTRAQLEYISN